MSSIDYDDVACQLVYLVAGVEYVTGVHRVTNRLAGATDDHPIVAGGGHVGMVSDLLPYARQVSEYLTAKVGQQDFPGVFEYEVTESLGTWLANNWETSTHDSFAAELEAQGSAFFSQ